MRENGENETKIINWLIQLKLHNKYFLIYVKDLYFLLSIQFLKRLIFPS